MDSYKTLASKTFWLGLVGLATMFLGGSAPCKAQEVNPAQFTDTGVEDAYPPRKPAPKVAKKVVAATHPKQTVSNQSIARRRKSQHAARKQNVAFTPNL